MAPRPREISPVARIAFPASRSPDAGECLGAAAPDASPLPWPSRSLQRSALPCSPLGAHMSTRQDSLDGTGCWFAPPSQRETPLRHTGSPPCHGSLLRGSLAITATGLAPVSCQCLSGHTSAWFSEGFRTNTRPTSGCWPGATRHPDSAPDFAATHDTHVVPAPIMCRPRHMAISWYPPGMIRSTAAWIVSILN